MTQALQFYTLVIPAGANIANVFQPGAAKIPNGGAFLYVQSCTQPFLLQFDAEAPFPCQGGYRFTQTFGTATALNPTTIAITVVIAVGTTGIDYIGTNQVKVASTYALGNLGLNASGNYNGQAVTVVVNNGLVCVKLTYPQVLTISGLNNGHQRKGLVFTNGGTSGSSTNSLVIADANGNACFPIQPSVSMYLESDATFTVWSPSGTVYFSILELYYAN